uniref:CSON010336 protein n=1 Tax=Culicoides sonorensis TaxID=179676 RepID=A0A336N3C1_CULSO
MPSDLEIEEIHNLLSRHRIQIGKDIEAHLLGLLVKKNVLTLDDEEFVSNGLTIDDKCNRLIEIISKNGYDKFQEFCYSIESEFTKLITDLINDGLNCSKLN